MLYLERSTTSNSLSFLKRFSDHEDQNNCLKGMSVEGGEHRVLFSMLRI